MDIEFNHKFGLLEHHDLQHYTVTGRNAKVDEYDDLLAQGWLMHQRNGEQLWYQSRSTRCNLSNATYSQFTDNQFNIGDYHQQKHHLKQIYLSYCQYKGYNNLFSEEAENWLSIDMLFEYYHQKEFVAWSKIRTYSPRSAETVLFAWDYQNPDAHIGINSLHHELAWAKHNGYQYVYMGQGYELGCLYKAKIQGFEWWTGKEWSQDTQAYKRACRRDHKIKTVADLAAL